MYKKLPRSDENVLGYEIREVLTEDQLDEILTEIEETIADHGSVRLLVSMPSVPYPDVKAIDDDLGFWLRHSDNIDRYAVVGESPLLEWSSDIADRVTEPDIEYFEQTEIDDAWSWVKTGRDNKDTTLQE
jgi:hypothetical protein